MLQLLILVAAQLLATPADAAAERYLGAFIQEDVRYKGDMVAFEKEVGAPLSFYATYRAYGKPFPLPWARELIARQRGMLIFWEPWEYGQKLPTIEEDAYLRRWAGTLSRLSVPVWLVFGSEANVNQDRYPVPYAAFRDKYRLVSGVMRRMAPRVQMVFSLAAPAVCRAPKCAELYYPGNEFVDWIAFTNYDNGMAGAWRRLEICLEWATARWPEKGLGITEVGCERLSPGSGSGLMSFLQWGLDAYPQLGFVSYFSYDAQHRARDPKPVSYALRPGSEAMAAVRWAVANNKFRHGPPPPAVGAIRESSDSDPYVLRGEALRDLYLALPAQLTERPAGGDVSPATATAWLTAHGVVQGDENGDDRAEDAIMGFELALITSRAVGLLGKDWSPAPTAAAMGYRAERFEMSPVVREAVSDLEQRGLLTASESGDLWLFGCVHRSTLADFLRRLSGK